MERKVNCTLDRNLVSDHPTRQTHTVGTCSCHRPPMRVLCWLLRSDNPFSVAFRPLLSAGFRGSEYRSRDDMSAPILVHFGPSPALLKTVYTRAGIELTDPQEGCKLKDIQITSSGEQPCLGVRQC